MKGPQLRAIGRIGQGELSEGISNFGFGISDFAGSVSVAIEVV